MPTTAAFRRLPLVPLAGLALIVLALALIVALVRGQSSASDWVSHTIQTEASITRLLERVRAVESAHRGFLIRPDAVFLTDLNEASDASLSSLETIERLTADNPVQLANAAKLRRIVEYKIAYAREGAQLRQDGKTAVAVASVQGGRGRLLMLAVNARAQVMLGREEALLADRTLRSQQLIWWFSAAMALAVALLVAVTVVMVRDARARFEAMQDARDDARRAVDRATEEIASREAAETQLRQLQKMESIGQLTGGIAHDFNNMLAIVIGSLDMARRRLDDRERLDKCLDNAREGAERAAALTSRLLAFSRQQPLAPNVLDTNRLVGSMSELLRRTLGEDVQVETVLAGGLWRCYADPSQLENALLNLAVNARDAMPGGGRLTIETGNAHLDDAYAATRADVTPGQYVALCVSDTGSGMPADVIERAFDPFFTTKDVGKGTGLGLSQVFGFVKQSGGHVAIYSEIGEGTTVKLYLPRFSGPLPIEAEPVAFSGEMPAGRADEIILVVEDEQRVRHFSVDALRELGYTALSAPGGVEALKILIDTPAISLLFTDVVMPEMNGRRLAEEARALRPDLKILYTTGYTRNAVVHNGMLDAGVAFLPKPFTISQLARKIREVLDGGGVNRAI